MTEGDGKERGRCQDFVVLFGLFFDVFPTEALMEVVVVRLPFATLFLPCFGFPDCVFVPPLGDDSASNLATTGKSTLFVSYGAAVAWYVVCVGYDKKFNEDCRRQAHPPGQENE